jgi:medium-chain acyl-[acyl-carrier-protein] hydrolase
VTQYRLNVQRLPEYDSLVTLLSWPGKTMHLYFPRYFRLQDEKGKVLLDAVSLWVLIDEKTRSIVFPEDHGIEIPETLTGFELPLPGRLRREETASSHSFTVPYSYVDLNGHMNNARYYDLAQDIMPEELRRRKLASLSSEYIGEARLGDTLRAGCALSRDAFYVCGSTEKPIFRMKFEFAGKEEQG